MKILAVVTVLLVTAQAPLAAQDACRNELESARSAYAVGDFDSVLGETGRCLALPRARAFRRPADGERRTTSVERAAAWEWQAMAHLALDDTLAAQASVERLLAENPEFQGDDIEDAPRFLALVRQVIRTIRLGATTAVSKSSERILEAPATVVVVTGDDIRRRGYMDLEAVLHDLPGFDISRPRGQAYSNVYQRGYRSEATDRTLLIVDGVEQNDIFSNTAFITRQYPLSNIERIEVVYGPASTMYGANAFLGVINVITKDPEELLLGQQAVGYEGHASVGPWSTRAVDATVAGRYLGASFSLTGRLFESDGWDASESWEYDRSSPEATELYKEALFGLAGRAVSPEQLAAVSRARALDEQAYAGTLNGHPVGYSERAQDWMVLGKLKVRDLQLGFQFWQQDEGTGTAGTSRSMPGGLNGNVWRPYQSAYYARYSSQISGSLAFNYLGQAKIHGIGDGSARFRLQGYLDGPFGLEELEKGTPAFWTKTQVREVSSQVRNEIDLVFRPMPNLSLVGGVELRNGSIQDNYEQVTDCAPVPGVLDSVRGDPAAARQMILDGVPGAEEHLSDRIVKILSGRSSSRCVSTPAEFEDNPLAPSGGNHYRVRDFGVFAQASYSATPSWRLVAGWRIDNNRRYPVGGTGTVGSPRLAIVHIRGDYVLRGVFAGAFKAPSGAEQFSSVGSVRAVATNALEPERAKNIELSVGRQTEGLLIDASIYRTAYSQALANINHGYLLADREVNDFLTAYAASGFDQLPLDSLTGSLVDKLLYSPSVTRSFENLGGFTVWGVQLSASGRVGQTNVFANYNYTNPKATGSLERYIGVDAARERVRLALAGTVNPFEPAAPPESIRISDMASHRITAGAAHGWDDLEVSLRTNIVGRRQVGEGTTVATNPRTAIDAYMIVNGSLSYRVNGGLTAQLAVDNLLDARYWHPGNGVANDLRAASRVLQPPRSLFMRLLIGF